MESGKYHGKSQAPSELAFHSLLPWFAQRYSPSFAPGYWFDCSCLHSWPLIFDDMSVNLRFLKVQLSFSRARQRVCWSSLEDLKESSVYWWERTCFPSNESCYWSNGSIILLIDCMHPLVYPSLAISSCFSFLTRTFPPFFGWSKQKRSWVIVRSIRF